MTRLYIGNLASEFTNDRLQQLFSNKGFQLTSVRVICDREGGRSRGFGFVEFASREEAERAIGELHGSDVEGRTLQVSEARSRENRGGHGYSQPRANQAVRSPRS
jgi:cold-inducible RNA-binding protein